MTDMQTTKAILWRSLSFPGHESCRLFSVGKEWHLQGTAVFLHDQRACRLDYRIICDAAWHTLAAHVEGWLGTTLMDIQIKKVDLSGFVVNYPNLWQVEASAD
jgi:hypothetical protein